ncbi:hypothetical protein HYV84_05005 [Candidatus Woesearchaeota archaeon]|nr:hypothetical protein [Candidatus Woesearchaeota archaeon]
MPECYNLRPVSSLDEVRYEHPPHTALERPLKRTPKSRYARMVPAPLALYLLTQMGCDSPTRVEVKEDNPGELSIQIEDKDGISMAAITDPRYSVLLHELGKADLPIDFVGFGGASRGDGPRNPKTLRVDLKYKSDKFDLKNAELQVADTHGKLLRQKLHLKRARGSLGQ